MRIDEFNARRLAEFDAIAQHAGPARIAWLTYCDDNGQLLYTTVAAGEEHAPWVADGHELPKPSSARIVYDPARALRQAAAMWRVVHRHAADYLGMCVGCPVRHDTLEPSMHIDQCPDQRDVATIWADHPDFERRWAR